MQLSLLSWVLAEEPPSGHTFLTSTNWSASAYAQHEGGSACWLVGDNGSLRVEVLRDPEGSAELSTEPRTGITPKLEPLLTRSGNGWTLVLGPDGNGTLNAWGREWRQVPEGLAQMVRLVTASLRIYPGRPPEFPFASSVGPSRRPGVIPRPKVLGFDPSPAVDADVWRYQLAPLLLRVIEDEEEAGFRRKMTTRGRGAGGLGEVLVLNWSRPAGQAGYGLRIGSSRRPGTLSLEPPRDLAVTKPDPEVFLPLWPLSQFFETR
jgi:hypothetical protein